jgi:TPR repeat protein
MFRDALKLRMSQREKDVRQLAGMHGDLGMTLWREGKLAEARQEVSAGVSLLRQATDHESRRALALLLNKLAGVLIDGTRGHDFDASHGDAEATLREALDIQKTLLEKDHPETLETLNSLAAVLFREVKLGQAETIAREVFAARQKMLGGANPNLANSLNLLGVILRDEGQLAEAESTLRAALEMRRKIFSKDNADLAQSIANLGTVLKKRGRFEEAEKLLNESLAMRQRLFPEGNLEFAQNFNELGVLLQAEGKLSGAEIAQREALGMMRKLLGESHPYTGNCVFALGSVLESEGRWGQARQLYHDASRTGGAYAAKFEFSLGQLYSDGRGTARDLVEAAKWFRISADRGLRASQVMLGQAYANGLGVPLDSAEAAKWYRKAAEQGHKIAQYRLGRMYANGIGLVTNETEAIKWYRKSADAAYGPAQIAIGHMYASGTGMTKDGAEAQRWYNKAVKLYLNDVEATWSFAAAGNPESLNAFAWTSATSENPGVRDGRVAMLLAEWAVTATGRTNDQILDTLAAAYAEAGQFTNAVKAQKEALSLVGDEIRDDYKSRLKLYESGSAFRVVGEDFLVPTGDMPEMMAGLFHARGKLCAQYSQWKAAIADMQKAIDLVPTNHETCYELSALLIQAGDLEGYRTNCHREVAWFSGTKDPHTAHRMVKSCLARDDSGVAPEQTSEWADTAIRLGTNDWAWPSHFQFTKALAEYRQGHFASATEWIQKWSPREGTDRDYFEAEVGAVLAMARQRLGQSAAAREALERALRAAGPALAMLDDGRRDLGPGWLDWIFAKCLLDEAKAIVGNAYRTPEEKP